MQRESTARGMVASNLKRHSKYGGQMQILSPKAAVPTERATDSKLPDRPFQHVAVDLCELRGKHFFVLVDCYSRWIDIMPVSQLSSGTVINKLKESFATHGVPETVFSDNGPQFASAEFNKFSQEWNFSHTTSSPHYPRSNGEAERAVRTAKEILQQNDIQLALLTYRATPLPALHASPAELAVRRRLRTTLPATPKNLAPSITDPKVIQQRYLKYKQSMKSYCDRGTQLLPEFHPTDPVLVKEDGEKAWKTLGEIIRKCTPRSYIVKMAGGEKRRNRRHLCLDTSVRDGGAARTYQAPVMGSSNSPPTAALGLPQQSAGPPLLSSSTPSGQPAGKPPDTDTDTSHYTTRSGRQVVKPARFQ